MSKIEIAEIMQGHVIQLVMWSQHGGPHLAELFTLFFLHESKTFPVNVCNSLAAMSK